MPTSADGRVERRERNRTSVVEALLDLYRDGQLAPSADVIARRAGVSPRSLFRYFDDVDALVEEAVRQQQERLAPRLAVAIEVDQPFERRLQQVVAARLDLYDEMGQVARVARSIVTQQPRIAAELARIRTALRTELSTTFAAELRVRRGAARERGLAAADVLLSWEAVDLLRGDHGLDRAATEATLVAGLRAVLG